MYTINRFLYLYLFLLFICPYIQARKESLVPWQSDRLLNHDLSTVYNKIAEKLCGKEKLSYGKQNNTEFNKLVRTLAVNRKLPDPHSNQKLSFAYYYYPNEKQLPFFHFLDNKRSWMLNAKIASLASADDRQLFHTMMHYLIKLKTDNYISLVQLSKQEKEMRERYQKAKKILIQLKPNPLTNVINIFYQLYKELPFLLRSCALEKARIKALKEFKLVEKHIHELCDPPKKKDINAHIKHYNAMVIHKESLPFDSCIKHKQVQQQDGAECGLHAFWNALQSAGYTITLNTLRAKVLKSVRKEKNDAEWLENDELKVLLKKPAPNKLSEDIFENNLRRELKKHITIIGDINLYLNKETTTGKLQKTIKRIATIQEKIREYVVGSAPYSHIFILGTMDGRRDYEMEQEEGGHWIAVEVKKYKNNKIKYIIMDSLSRKCAWQLTAKLKDLLELPQNVIKKVIIDKNGSFSDLKTVMEWSQIVIGKKYAFFEGNQNDGMPILRVFPNELLQRILYSCQQFLAVVKDNESFYCGSNYIEKPWGLIKDALKNIELCTLLEPQVYSDDINSESISIDRRLLFSELEEIKKQIESIE